MGRASDHEARNQPDRVQSDWQRQAGQARAWACITYDNQLRFNSIADRFRHVIVEGKWSKENTRCKIEQWGQAKCVKPKCDHAHMSCNSGWAWASLKYTRNRKRFYMFCIYKNIFACLWGDHFSEERVQFRHSVGMVVMHMHSQPVLNSMATWQITCRKRHER